MLVNTANAAKAARISVHERVAPFTVSRERHWSARTKRASCAFNGGLALLALMAALTVRKAVPFGQRLR